MSNKGQKKNIVIPDQSLYGADSDSETEFIPPKKTSKKSVSVEKEDEVLVKPTTAPVKAVKKTKMTKKTLAAVTEFTGQVTEFLISFLQEQGSGKLKVQDILSAWQSEDTQLKLADMVKLRMPVPKPIEPRKAKDPNAPKRPRSAYIFFCNDKRAEIKEKNPDMKMPDIARKLGEMWKGLKEKKKQPYLDEAAKDKARYDSEMGEYSPKNKAKGPKRALTSYFFFCADKRAEVKETNPDMKVTDIARELGRMWKEDFADEKSRTKWVKSAEKDKKRYEEEKAAWIEEHPEEAKNVPKSKSGSKSKSKEDAEDIQHNREAEDTSVSKKAKRGKKSKNEGPIRASGMILYMQQSRSEIESENPDWDTRQVIAEMKKRWSALSAEERSEYDQ